MNKRYVVVSTNNNPDYMFYAPYIEKAWATLGWNLCIMITADVNPKDLRVSNPETIICKLPEIPGVRKETEAQGGRLYAANYLPSDSFIMTSDMDLLPLSDYWKPDENKITVFGHDLTDYTYFPMGYIAMSCEKWKQVMELTMDTARDFERDCKASGLPYAPDWEQWWNYDWDHITKKLRKQFMQEIQFVNRGRRPNSPFAAGRIDRGDSMTMIPEPWIDAHCENNNVQHPDKLGKFLQIFESKYGKL